MKRMLLLLLALVCSPAVALEITDVGTVEGCKLILNPGVQELHERLVIPETISEVVGAPEGELSVLRFSGPDINLECVGTLVKNHPLLKFQGFSVIGDHDGSPTGSGAAGYSGFGIRKVDKVIFEDVEVSYVPGLGITSGGVIDLTVKDCRVHDVGRDGCTHYGRQQSVLVGETWVGSGWADGRTLKSVKISGCRIWNVGDDSIAFWLSSAGYYCYHEYIENVLIEDNLIISVNSHNPKNFSRGVALGGVKRAIIRNNTIVNAPTNGIWVGYDTAAMHKHNLPARDCEDVLIMGNRIVDVGRYQGVGYAKSQIAISARNVNGYFIDKNVIDGVYLNKEDPAITGTGLDLSGAANGTLGSNTIKNTGRTFRQ